MRKRNTIISILVLAVIAGVAIYFSQKNTSSTIVSDQTAFAVEDTDNITRLFLADKNGNDVTLERKGNDWIVDGEFEARQSGVNVLLSTINQLAVQAPVSKNKYETVLKKIASDGIKVEIYKNNKHDKPFKTFYLGSNNLDHTGNFTLLEGATRPYLMHVEGFYGYLTPRFIVRSNDWRKKHIFKYAFGEIAEISTKYPGEPQKDFTIKSLGNNNFELYNGQSQKIENIDKPKLLSFVSMFKERNFESFEEIEAQSFQDSVAAQTPEMIVSVTDTAGEKTTVKTFKKRIEDGEDLDGNEIEYDLDRFYATLNDSNFIVIQYFVFDPVTAELDYFKK